MDSVSAGMAATIFSTGNGRPITPVEEMKDLRRRTADTFRQFRGALPCGVHSRFASHGIRISRIHQDCPNLVS
jgi:hypothetical protein